MDFFERVIKLRTDTIFNFLCSILSGLVFAPIRLIQEIGKKVVYLSLKELDQLMFVSCVIGLFATVLLFVIRQFLGVFDLTSGSLPFWIPVAGDVLLGMLYSWFSYESKTSLYRNVKASVKKDLHTASKTSVAENDINDSKATEHTKELEQRDVMPNEELLSSQKIKEYQNQLQQGILELTDLDRTIQKFSADELQNLKSTLSAVTPPGRFVSKELVDELQAILDDDEEAVSDVNPDVPDDFSLLFN